MVNEKETRELERDQESFEKELERVLEREQLEKETNKENQNGNSDDDDVLEERIYFESYYDYYNDNSSSSYNDENYKKDEYEYEDQDYDVNDDQDDDGRPTKRRRLEYYDENRNFVVAYDWELGPTANQEEQEEEDASYEYDYFHSDKDEDDDDEKEEDEKDFEDDEEGHELEEEEEIEIHQLAHFSMDSGRYLSFYKKPLCEKNDLSSFQKQEQSMEKKTCGICLEEVSIMAIACSDQNNEKSKHVFCVECLGKMIVEEGSSCKLALEQQKEKENEKKEKKEKGFCVACPHPGCGSGFDTETLKKNVPGFTDEFWQEKVLSEQNKMNRCPGCDGCFYLPKEARSCERGKRTSVCARPGCAFHGQLFCVDCKRACITKDHCTFCLEAREYENPKALNRYILTDLDPFAASPDDASSKEGQKRMKIKNKKFMARNEEVTVELALESVKAIMGAEPGALFPMCTICNVHLEKSTDCNALCHCDAEVCYACGRRSLPGAEIEPSHWQKCPRYFESGCVYKALGYRCVQGKCFTELEACADPEHEQGRLALHEYRKDRHAGALLESLDPAIREKVLSLL